MNLPRRSLLAVLLMLPVASLAGVSPALGQNLTRATLEGVVRDPAGAPLGDANLTLRDAASGATLTAATTRDGRFRFVFLLPGDFELLVERFGYGSRRLIGIRLGPGERRSLPVDLRTSEQLSGVVDTARVAPAPVGVGRFGVWQHFSEVEIERLPEEHRTLTGLGRLSSAAGSELDFQGLPASMTGVAVDGIRAEPAGGLGSAAASGRNRGLPLSALSGADLLLNAVDVEWQAGSGAVLAGDLRRGSSTLRVEALGSGSSGQDRSGAGAQAGVVVSGPIVRDTATFVLGVEAWRLEQGLGPSAALADLRTRFAAAAGVPADEPPLRSDRVAGFGRVDWSLGATHSLTLRSTFGGSPRSDDRLELAPRAARPAPHRDAGLTVDLDLASRLSERLGQEIRVGGSVTTREYQIEALPGSGAPGQGVLRTGVVEGGRVVWLDPGIGGTRRQTSLHASETLFLDGGAHQWKLGLAAGVRGYSARDVGSPSGSYLSSGVGGFSSSRGAFGQTLGGGAEVEFSIPSLAAYLQDVWRAAPGLELLLGARFEAEALPAGDIVRNEAWQRRTGMDNSALQGTRSRLSPRVGLLWDVHDAHRWILSASAGLYSGAADPGLLAEALLMDTGGEARAGFGALAGWPLPPDSVAAPLAGSRLALLTPGYSAPRTTRGSAQLAHHLTRRTTVRVAVDHRRTDFLPRRVELNLLAQPASTDQFGRPVYGELRKEGGLVGARSGSNRRFAGFDAVSAVEVDGWSTYRGVTVGADHRGSALTLFGSYTRSSTEDNWPADLAPLPFAEHAVGDRWEEGPSDLDVPSRGVAGLHVRAPWMPALAVGMVYRYRSGYPFTPGLGAGVDANADGTAGNDPAFVSLDVAGTDALVAAHPCLGTSLGAFAARNSCRGPESHSVDARLSLRLLRASGRELSLLVDGLNLTGAELVIPDAALYLVDPARPLVASGGRVTVPLRVNPAFGEPLYRIGSGRTLRLGVRLFY